MLVNDDIIFMQEAMKEAKKAEQSGEVPVGAVIVHQGDIIARGYNQPIKRHDPTAHAEIMALRRAGEHLNNYRLTDTILYCTLEPCVMCAGAMVHARVSRVVYGANDQRTGACGSVFDLITGERLNHRIEKTAGVLERDCASLLRNFFKTKRKK